MRMILIGQALLLLIAAWYIYTLKQAVPPPVPVVDETASVEVRPAAVSVPPEQPVVAPAVAPTVDMGGPTDAGMEWPTLESEVEMQ